MTLSHEEFRALFPALTSHTWFDTPGAPPAAEPVASAVRSALDDWTAGRADWLQWDAVPQQVRTLIAAAHRVPATSVALLTSVSEAAATVSAAHPTGAALVLDSEYRSVRFPFMQRREVLSVPVGADRTTTLIEALHPGVSLVAFSEILSSDGERVDVRLVCEAAHAVGARVFVDATQSFGVLDTDHVAAGADYVAVHGYKWMLCPRGAAWLVATDHSGLAPLAPGWKSTPRPHGYFGGELELGPGITGLDSSPAWLSWIGAQAALDVHLRLDIPAVHEHVTALRETLATHASELGYTVIPSRLPSHLAVIESDRDTTLPEMLAQHAIKATATPTRLRIGLHYFNNQLDIDKLVGLLKDARSGPPIHQNTR
ncbi:aminotransferase class V-fold PLP-dependent enzyme [Mycolicibacterium goodii]|uniref:aminotransferase class V-fold PLP-dependent enzyme n=1 Tax=Mycolicibacterium goodii TaxID=134601 RepID=UPI000673796D